MEPESSRGDLFGRQKPKEGLHDRERAPRTDLPPDVQALIRELEAESEELRRSKRELQEECRHYAELYDLSPVGYFLLDRDGAILRGNRAGARLLGFEEGVVPNVPLSALVKEEDRGTFSEHLRDVFEGRERRTGEIRIAAADGSVRHVQLQSVVASDVGVICAAMDITEQKESEKALRETRDTLQAVLDAVPAGVVIADKTGSILFTSAMTELILGAPVTGDAYSPRRGYTLSAADGSPIPRGGLPLMRAIEGCAVTDMEILVERSDGAHAIIVAGATPLRAAGGEIWGAVAVFLDITERKRTEEALRESEARYRALAELNPDATLVTQGGHCVFANAAAARLLGAEDPRQLLGRTVSDVIAPEYAEMVRERMHGVLDEGRPAPLVEYEWLRLDGSRVPVEVAAGPVDWKGLRASQVVARDMTDRRRAEAALRESEARYRELVQNANSAIVRWTVDGTVTFINEFAVACFGYAPEEVVGGSVSFLIPERESTGRDLSSLAADIVAHPDRYASNVNENVCRDGRRLWMAWTNKPIANERGEIVEICSIGSDITARKRMEEALQESQERLREYAEELEARVIERTERVRQLEQQRAALGQLAAAGRVAARVAHEINNPLAGIKNAFVLLKDAIPEDHKYYRYVPRIQEEIDRIAQIVRQMFQLVRPPEDDGPYASIATAIEDVTAIQELACRKRGIALETRIEGGWDVSVPGNAVRQILFNLLQNAMDVTPSGGTVRVSASRTRDGGIEVAVADEGPGIPEERRPFLFEPFYTTKDVHKATGLGLGLSISKSLAEGLGGALTFSTTLGQGTTFTLALPPERRHPEGSGAA